MADKLTFIKRLRPIGIEFEPYSENPLEIKMAPKLWSSHRYNTVKGYHYKISLIDSNSILIKLENICPKDSIVFNEVKLNLDDFIEMLSTSFKQDKNFITVTVDVSYDLSKCDTCIRVTKACKNLSNTKIESIPLKIYFSKDEIIKALDYYKNYENYATIDDRTVATVSSYNKNEKETKTMETNQMSNFLGIQCGVINNPNIAATALGICFKNEAGNWIKFDPKTRQRVDMANIQVGNLGPLYLIPSRTVEVGTPIMYENDFYYVMDTSDLPKLTLLSVTDGVEKTVYPSTNLLGINFFAKVVALIDADNLLGGDGDDMLTVLALTGGLGGNNAGMTAEQSQQMNPLLLLALAKDGEGSPLSGLTDGGGLLGNLGGNSDSPLGKLLPLMLLSGGLNGAGGGQGNIAGLDLNNLILLSALGKKKTAPAEVSEKATPKKTAAKPKSRSKAKSNATTPKEETPQPLTAEDVARIVAQALEAQKYPAAPDADNNTNK